jgi:ADP-ribosylation factor-like protein 13B
MGACGSKGAAAGHDRPGSVAAQKGGNSGELTLLVIGLDNSGKSTLTLALNGDMDPFVVPTVGFSAPIKKKGLHGADVTFYDLGGGMRIRGVWPNYFADVHGVLYVVDASDKNRLKESADELTSALSHPMIVGKPLLV